METSLAQLELIAAKRMLQPLPSLGATLLVCLFSLVENDLINEDSIREMNRLRSTSVVSSSLTNYLWIQPEFVADFREFCVKFAEAYTDAQREELILVMNERWNTSYFYKPHLTDSEK